MYLENWDDEYHGNLKIEKTWQRNEGIKMEILKIDNEWNGSQERWFQKSMS